MKFEQIKPVSIGIEDKLEYAEKILSMFDKGEFFGTCFTCAELETMQERASEIKEKLGYFV